ncbi:DUF2493 domain-containing protein [Sphingomonas sp. UNC305MFCol5.2]|uniref:DUF2493 domain-containing protein n=1 Tax=Sphingomonas sp. UNC305MFCol5.2 TaxID=1449076 RepID=UPI0004A6A8CF|nr:DUF2493 domain-containing protein [Sphingomonas sp. UNC305MFCol5.2]
MTQMFDTDSEAEPAACATAVLLEELARFGYRPFSDEPDPRPLPAPERAAGAVADMADALVSTLQETRLEDDIEDLLWALANLFHRAEARIQRLLDDNADAQRAAQRAQDGSEVRSVELERITAEGISLVERRNAMEFLRDCATAQFALHTGSAWLPRTGSLVRRRTLTAAMVDSREFLLEQRRAARETLVPRGTRIAFTGGVDCGDHQAIWKALDRTRARHPDMVLLHGGTPTGAERIAACWADQRGVAQVLFRPDWKRHGKAAPFKRNDQLLECLPVGLIVFPGSGISANLADKARIMGIPLWRFDRG